MRIDRRSSKFSSIIIRLDRRYTISPPLPQIILEIKGDNVGTGGAKGRRDLVAELSRWKLGIGGQRSEGDVVSRPKGQSLLEGGQTMEEKERGRFTVLVGPAEMQPYPLHPRHVGHVEISQGVSSEKVKSK